MKNHILTFGRYKGKPVRLTPKWYQNWLKNQEWFMKDMPIQETLIKKIINYFKHE